MFKKSLASVVSAAVLVAGPGHLTLTAAAQTIGRAPVTGVSVTPTIGTGFNAPSSFSAPTLAPNALLAPSLSAAPSVAAPAPVAAVQARAAAATPAPAPALAVSAKAIPAAAKGSPLSVIRSQDPKTGVAEKSAALNTFFDASVAAEAPTLEVAAAPAASAESGLTRSAVSSAKSPASIERAALDKRAAAGELAVVSLLKRAWNAVLGMLGIGVKKLETPEVMAQRILDQLNAAKPVYNRKVQEASTLVERLKLQVEGETKKVAELELGITALLSDSDPANDIMASGMINQQKTLAASIAASQEQIALADKTLASIKEERARFFSEREETIAKIQAGLTKSAAADIQKQIAELKGGFQIGDLKDNMDRFEDAVNDKVADAKGTVDSVESNPDQILKKAKDSLKSQEIKDELARRKAEIEKARQDKGQAGGAINVDQVSGALMGAVLAAINPLTALVIVAALGALTLGDDLMTTRKGMNFANIDKAGKFFAYSIGTAIMGVMLVGFGLPLLSASSALVFGTSALSAILGYAHIRIAKAKNNDKGQGGGLLLELGIGAAVIAVVAAVSKPFRNILARAWNAALGMLGIGVKKLETPEVMAQRIIDQLNAQKPVYNRKVQEASTLVEKLRLQIEKQEKQSAELDRSVTAILSDSDPLNDVMAESLLNQKKTVDASTAMTQEQLTISEKTLVSIKEERASFFSEREEMLAKIQAGLTKSKAAEIQKQIAELKGGFQIGDLKDNMDRFEDAVNDKVADAKGTVDSVESNPDQILKKAKDALKNQEVQDEIAKRKAAIEAARKAKGEAGGDASQSKALGYFAKAIGIGFALISPWLSSAVFALLGLVSIAMAPEQGRWFGRQLAVIGLGTLAVGGLATLATAKLGLTLGAFSVGVAFVVPALLALSAGIIAALRAHQKAGAAMASAAATPAGSSVQTPAPVSAPAASSPKASFSIKPLLDLLARAWNALLGIFGMGVKKMETPEVMAQRLIDQLNDAKPVYNNKVREASTLVEKLRQQIASEEAKIAEFEKTITALLSDNDPSNDILASGLINSQKTLQISMALTKEQLVASEKGLENIKEERARFFSEREETLAKIQAGLTKVKAAEIQKEIAELKGGFQIGDLKDNMDRFEGAVNDRVADAKGTVDSVDSNPDQILKKAKDSMRTAEINDEIARRKAEIEKAKQDKGRAGGAVSRRDLSMKELFTLNAVGVVGSIAAGVLLGAPLLGILGTFVAPIPVILAYVGALRLAGVGVNVPGIRFAPSVSWAGKSYPLTKTARDDKGAAGGLLLESMSAGTLAATLVLLGGAMTYMLHLVSPISAMARLQPVRGQLLAMPGVSAIKVRNIMTSPYGAEYGVRVTLDKGADMAAAAEALRPWESKLALPIEIEQGANSRLLGMVDSKAKAGGLLLELGVGAAVIALVAAVSKPFRNILARAWNAVLGMLGMGVKKMETPEVMAQRIIDQLNAQKPIYNRKVQEASTLVEKLRLQIEKQEKQSAELDRSVTAILSDSDPLNDVMAESLLNQKKTVDASTVMTKEQLAISEKTLISIKEERASFFSEREEMLAKIQAGLTKSKAAEIQKQIAELKGGFQIGDLKDNMDRFEDAVNDKVADAKGTVDSVESNPDQILKKAKDALKNQEVQDEIAKRKAAIEAARKAKGEAGGAVSLAAIAPLALMGMTVPLWAAVLMSVGAALLALKFIARDSYAVQYYFVVAGAVVKRYWLHAIGLAGFTAVIVALTKFFS